MPEGDTLFRTAAGLRPYLVGRDVTAARAQGPGPIPQVQRVVCGHHHRPIVTRWAGTVGSVAPSTAHQVTLHLAPGNEPSTFTLEPPAYQIHTWDEAAGLISHTAYVGRFAGPYPFILDEDYPGHERVKVAETA